MKKTVVLLFSMLMLLSLIPFASSAADDRYDLGTLYNYGGVIELDAEKDPAYERYGIRVALNVLQNTSGTIGTSGGTVYWLLGNDYKTLYVFVEAQDGLLDDQKYYDDDGNEIMIYDHYYDDDDDPRTDFDMSLYEFDEKHKIKSGQEMPYPTALEATRYEYPGSSFWISDGVEVWVNPNNNFQNEGSGEGSVQAFHYKVDIGGYRHAYFYQSTLRGDDCEGVFDAKVKITERNEKTGQGRYNAEFAIDLTWYNESKIPTKNEKTGEVTLKRWNPTTLKTEIKEGGQIGLGCQQCDHNYSYLTNPHRSGGWRDSGYYWGLSSYYMEHTLKTAGLNEIKTHPFVTAGRTVQFTNCETLEEEHDWHEDVTPATCGAEGKIEYKCRLCGAVKDPATIPADPTAHVSDGNTECANATLCTVCGATLKEAGAHTFSEWAVEKEASCTEDGLKVRTCLYCEEGREEEAIPALGHTAGEWVVEKEASCTEEGLQYRVCAVCGENREEEAIPAGHKYVNGKCEVCGEDDPDFIQENPFKDVKKNAWFKNAVDYVYARGLMTGTTDETFAPNVNMSRAMLVSVLYRYYGSPEPTTENKFADVSNKKSNWYLKAVTWAAENNVVAGIGDGTKFDPEGNVTREQIASIFYRFASFIGREDLEGTSFASFDDAKKVSKWAKTAMEWAVKEGLLQGSNNKLNPTGNATRAEVAAILMRFCQNPANNIVK